MELLHQSRVISTMNGDEKKELELINICDESFISMECVNALQVIFTQTIGCWSSLSSWSHNSVTILSYEHYIFGWEKFVGDVGGDGKSGRNDFKMR
jgi:hypothetical protein